jgi:hypothetical protein
MEHEARAGDGIDNWLIGRLRQQPRRARGEEVVERMLRPRALPDVVARLAALESALSELDLRLEAVEQVRTPSSAPPSETDRANGRGPRPEPSTRAEPRSGHTFFVPTPQGYELVEAEGATPGPGASVTIDGRHYTVEGSRRTPLPVDARPCLVLARAPSVSDETEDA